mmetsp:Transcript_24901/g.48652  ORF Transcript_24901/g.48652 Transcript_24901/m.48652 type:complete len:216 (-) Transcript_24901:203-850(-)
MRLPNASCNCNATSSRPFFSVMPAASASQLSPPVASSASNSAAASSVGLITSLFATQSSTSFKVPSCASPAATDGGTSTSSIVSVRESRAMSRSFRTPVRGTWEISVVAIVEDLTASPKCSSKTCASMDDVAAGAMMMALSPSSSRRMWHCAVARCGPWTTCRVETPISSIFARIISPLSSSPWSASKPVGAPSSAAHAKWFSVTPPTIVSSTTL